MSKTFFTIFVVLLAGLPVFAAEAPFKKVFVVILENEDAEDAYAQPFMRKLADEGAFMQNFHGVAHPSYPNYIALTSGGTWGIMTDSQVTLDVTHLGDQLDAKGKTWKTYAEGYPGNCFLRSSEGAYARKHVPFLSYKNVQSSPERCARVVNARELRKDIDEGGLSDFSLYIPDDNNNGHDTGVAYADKQLEKTFGPLLKERRFTDGLLFVVTFDEDDYLHRNRIYTALWGAGVAPGTKNGIRYDIYSLLRTVQEAFDLGTLGRNDAKAAPISGVWRR